MQHLEKRRNICALYAMSAAESAVATCGTRLEESPIPDVPQAFTDVADRSYEDNTMIRIISALILAVAATLCSAAEQPLQLADSAPDEHIVVPGDTLWGISAKFLKEPWRWPEIWRMNREQIKNPNRIYPGRCDRSRSRRRRQSASARAERQAAAARSIPSRSTQAIPPIPPNVIEPFISAPLVVEANGLDNAARIVATQQDRVFLGNGDLAYVENADPAKQHWQVYRNGKPLARSRTDRQAGSRLRGFLSGHGNAGQAGRSGDLRDPYRQSRRSVAATVWCRQSVRRWSPMFRTSRIVAIDGRIISVYGGVGVGGTRLDRFAESRHRRRTRNRPCARARAQPDGR